MHILNSRAMPGGQEVEWIGDGLSYLRWLRASGLAAVPTAENSAFDLDAIAAAAREFREWFRGFIARHSGRTLTSEAAQRLGPLNELLAQDTLHRTIEAADGKIRWSLARRSHDWQSLLQPLATAAGDFVCDADFSRVRQCEGSGCTIWFLDRTKGGKRRWCSMAICGNRAKASAHRARAHLNAGK